MKPAIVTYENESYNLAGVICFYINVWYCIEMNHRIRLSIDQQTINALHSGTDNILLKQN